jgi:hypothetical protein
LVWLLLGPLLSWLAAALTVSTAIPVMQLTRTLHPRSGATTLIAVIGSEQDHVLGYLSVLIPAVPNGLPNGLPDRAQVAHDDPRQVRSSTCGCLNRWAGKKTGNLMILV